MGITKTNSYYEDFQIGDRYIHSRGRTVTEMDNVMFTLLGMNTSEAHFNEDKWAKLPRVGQFGGRRVVVGTYTIGLVVGLTAEVFSENSLAEISMDKIRLLNPVYHGDTLYAESEILGKEETDLYPGAGIIHLKITGTNQEGRVVVEAEKKTAIKKRTTYLDDDQKFGP
ncbi:MAG: MaoC family dehydratase [Pseudomonadota bacterium]